MDRGRFIIIQRGPRLSPRRLDEAQMAHPTKRGERSDDLDEHLAVSLRPSLLGSKANSVVAWWGAPLDLCICDRHAAALPPQAHGPDAAADDRDST